MKCVSAMEKLDQNEPKLKIESNSKHGKKSSMKKSNSNQRIFYSSFDKQHTTSDMYSTSGGNQPFRLTNETNDIPFARRDYNVHPQVINTLQNN